MKLLLAAQLTAIAFARACGSDAPPPVDLEGEWTNSYLPFLLEIHEFDRFSIEAYGTLLRDGEPIEGLERAYGEVRWISDNEVQLTVQEGWTEDMAGYSIDNLDYELLAPRYICGYLDGETFEALLCHGTDSSVQYTNVQLSR